MDGAAPNLQDVLRLRQQDTFVGRDSRLAEFQDNLRLPALHPDRRYIVNIHGIAGVGKSFLLQQFRRIAHAEGAASALVDEDYFDVVETMSALAAELGRQDARLTEFESQLATYRQRRRELENDPNAPLGDLITTTTVRAGLSLAKTVPVAGTIAEFADSDAVAAQLNRFRAYLVQRFGKKSDIDLLLSPVEVLTRSFVASLNHIAAARPVALFFDTFERTAPYLESWLLNLFPSLSANVVTTIAGQLALADNRWSPLRSLIAAHPLEPFTEEEARDFLAQRGVTSEAVIEVILPLSGRVPMWLATLAERNPNEPGAVPDPSEDAVERFLKWEPDEERKKLAKAAALPRRFNRDILLAIPEAGGVADLFDWLVQLPFVSRAGEYWRYHDAVRDPMLRLARITSPQQWRVQHQALAAHFAEERDAIGAPVLQEWSDANWQHLILEETYHRLCAGPGTALPWALEVGVAAADEGVALARRWSAMLTEAGGATGAEPLRSRGRRLTDLLKDQDDRIAFLTALIDGGELSPDDLATALAVRGNSHYEQERYDQALADLDRALTYRVDQPKFFLWRGLTHRALRRYDEAIADFTSSLELYFTSGQVYAQRAITYRMVDRNEEAIADFDRAIEIEPGNDWYYMHRGLEYQILNRFDESLADLGRAIELDPADDTHFRQRGITYQIMERFEESLADFNIAIALDPEEAANFAQRGYTYHLMGHHDAGFEDLATAIEMNPAYGWTYVLRGAAFAYLNRDDEALADFTRAIELDPDSGMGFAQRGSVYRTLERFEEARADLDRAIELDPGNDWVLADRGIVLRVLGFLDLSLADLDRALELSPDYYWVLAQRGTTYLAMNRLEPALADLDRAVELAPQSDLARGQRGRVYKELERFDEALADLSLAIELAVDPYWDLVERGTTYRIMKRFEDCLADLDRAVALAPERAEAYAHRGAAYLDMERYEAAVEAYDRAAGLDPDDKWTIANRGWALRGMGRYPEALAAFDRAVELDPGNEQAIARRGDTHRQLGNLDAALADFDRAIELNPGDVWNHSQRSGVRFLIGDSEAAFADLDHVQEIDGMSGWRRFLSGVFHTASGREAEGAAEIRAAIGLVRTEIEAEPDSMLNRFNLVVALLAAGETEEARTALTEVLRAEPTSEPALYFLEDLAFLAACPGIEVEGLEEFSRTAREYWEARLAAEAE